MVQRVTPQKLPDIPNEPTQAPPRSGETVVVACKLPNGKYYQLYDMVEGQETTPTGYKKVMVAKPRGERIKLNGSVVPFGQAPEYGIHAGYGLTTISKEVWEEICRQYHDDDAIRNKLIFASDKPDGAQGRAREQAQAKIKSGLEPIDPRNPPPVGMKVTPATTVPVV
jgi:hypothetical protein